ncbi:MAG: STAS domain-containing protein [Planctomycetota bacterium]|nr:STAS domain-containing protein [Planctomycetota bacterium]
MSTEEEFLLREQDGDILILMPHGDFMKIRESQFRNEYNEIYRILTTTDVKHMLVDFQEIEYFGSTFIGILIRLAQRVKKSGGKSVLCNLNERMQDVLKNLMLLENVKVDFFCGCFDSRDEAISQIRNGGVA